MPPSENQSVAAPATNLHIHLHPKAGFDCEDGGCPRQRCIVEHQLSRCQKCAMCCSFTVAFGTALMIGLLIVGPLIKYTMVASDVTENHGQSIAKFMMPNANPYAGLERLGAMGRRPGNEMPSRAIPGSMRPVAGGGNEYSELARMEADMKDMRGMVVEQEIHGRQFKNSEVHNKAGATREPISADTIAQLAACFLMVIGIPGAVLYSTSNRLVGTSARPTRLAGITMSASNAASSEDSIAVHKTDEAENAADVPPLMGFPQSQEEIEQRAAAAVTRAKEAGVLRQIVKTPVPKDKREYKVFGKIKASALPELEAWPGGLVQQYPIAMGVAKQILKKVTGASNDGVSEALLSAQDAVGQVLAQGATRQEDATCIVFCGVDQLSKLDLIDNMADRRVLCLFNPQFERLDQFSLFARDRAKEVFFERGYECTFELSDFDCGDEDVKLIREFPYGYRAFIFLSDKDKEGVPLHDGYLAEPPEYFWLEKLIKERYPQKRWARELSESLRKNGK